MGETSSPEMLERVARAMWASREAQLPEADRVPFDNHGVGEIFVMAEAGIAAYQQALAEAGMVIVPNGVAKAMLEAEEASERIKAEIAETRERIRRGARGPGSRFKL